MTTMVWCCITRIITCIFRDQWAFFCNWGIQPWWSNLILETRSLYFYWSLKIEFAGTLFRALLPKHNNAEIFGRSPVIWRALSISLKYLSAVNPFFVMATQNPVEQMGTYPLPEAQVDRFLYKLIMSYPNMTRKRKFYIKIIHF